MEIIPTPLQDAAPIEQHEHQYLAAWHLFMLAQMAAGILPSERMDFDQLTPQQRQTYLQLVREAVDKTDKSRRWGMAK